MTDKETKLLRQRWAVMRGTMAPEWAKNFEAFRAWCEDNGWTPDYRVTRGPRGKPLGPDTARLVGIRKDMPLQPAPGVKPGWVNRPCVGCDYGIKQNSSICPCRPYWGWWNVTMAAYRRALMGKEDAMEELVACEESQTV